MPKTADCQTKRKGRTPATPVSDDWTRYHRTRSHRFRNVLIEKYLPLVRIISARLMANLPESVQIEDLISAGTFGLMDAIERYNPKMGSQFETYCAFRIRGAILDELRNLNWMPRTQCHRATKIGAAVQRLRGELGRTPTPREIARHSGLNLDQVRRAPLACHHVSLAHSVEESEDKTLGDILEARGICDPVDVLQEKELRDLLADEIHKLPRQERLIVMLYYFDELTMKQIGDMLDVTESRICQLHSMIIERLQQRLAELARSV